MQKCLGIKKNEKVLIVTNQEKLVNEANVFFESAKHFTKNVVMAVIPQLTQHGAEPQPELASLLNDQNIALLVTTYSLSHTQARKTASEKGVRIASMPGINMDIIMRTLSHNYFDELAKITKKVAGLMTMADNAHLTSSNGTNVTFSLQGRNGLADTGLFLNPGDFGNLPAGEGFTAPVEGKTQGVAVFDGAFADILIDQPIKVTFENGIATKIEGGLGARQLEIMINSIGPDARHVAELGIGTNKNCRLESSLIEVEKVFGTVHIAIGNNKHFGGMIDTPYHADGVILKPTLTLDDKLILKDGRFIL
jgi:leucyl aminopeptidase (aminopeptidase T)